MDIKIIGVDSKKGMTLLDSINKIEKQLKCKFNIERIASKNRDKYGIREVPTLMIGDDVISKEDILSEYELKKIIENKYKLCV